MNNYQKTISEHKNEKGKYEAHYKITSKQFQEFTDKAISYYAKNARITGFRKGQAPLNLVLQRFSEDINKYALELLLNALSIDLTDSDPKPDNRTNFEVTKLEQNKEDDSILLTITYIASVDIKIYAFDNEKKIKFNAIHQIETEEGFDNYSRLILKQLYKNLTNQDYSEDGKSTKDIFEEVFNVPEIAKNFPQINSWESFINETNREYKQNLKTEFFNNFIEELYNTVISKSSLPFIEKEIQEELDSQTLKYMRKFKAFGISNEKELEKKFKIKMEDLRKEWLDDIRFSIAKQYYLFEYANKFQIEPSEAEIRDYIKKNKKALQKDRPKATYEDIKENVIVFFKLLKAEIKLLEETINISDYTNDEKNILREFIHVEFKK